MADDRIADLLLRPRHQALVLFVLASFVIFARLGQGPLANYDDCFYAQKAKEMLRSGDWLTPHLGGLVRLDNPPLALWLMAASFALFGVSSYSAVLLSAISGVLCVVLLFRLAGRLGLEPFERWVAAFVLLTTQYFLKYTHHAMLDVFLTLLDLLAIDAYVKAVTGRPKQFLLVGVLAGLGVLTKSVLGLFPLGIAVIHMLWSGRGGSLFSRWFFLAILVAVGTAAPWYVYSYLAHGSAFLEEHVRWLLWKRAFVIGREAQPWYGALGYFKNLAEVYWPWLPAAVAGVVIEIRMLGGRATGSSRDAAPTAWNREDTSRLLLVWLVVVIGTMSIAIEKKLWYIMPAFPALALYSAVAIGRWVKRPAWRRSVTLGSYAFLALVSTILNLTPLGLRYERNPDLLRMALVVRGIVPSGQEVLNLDASYWNHIGQFLFYSDHLLTQPIGDPARVRDRLERGAFALLTRSGYEAVSGGNRAAYPVLASSGRWLLVRAAPAPTVELDPRDPYR